MPIRWRLTLWYAALLAVALAMFGVALYVGLRTRLYANFDDQLEGQAALLIGTMRVAEGRPALDLNEIPGEADEQFVRLWTIDGAVVVDTGDAAGAGPPDEEVSAAARAGETRFTSVRGADDPYRVITTPVRAGGEVVGVLQLGAARDDVEDALNALLSLLGIAAPLVFAVALGVGYVLAGRALAPVAAITALAAAIGGADLHARLDLPLPDDELGRLARTFDAMLARIEDAFERQRRFTGDAAHELRTPLTLLRSQVDLALARPRSSDEYREALRGIDGDLERLTGLVGTLLTLARADTGQLPLDRAALDLAATVAVILEQYAPLAAEVDIGLVDESTPAPLVGDEDLLVQVLVNVLDNALAHTPAGGRIAVGCRVAGERVRLWVADTGPGIPSAHQARIFDRFYRVDTGRARQHGGIGLGLAIAKAIAEAHGGTITLTSEAGRGTRVELLLPTTP